MVLTGSEVFVNTFLCLVTAHVATVAMLVAKEQSWLSG